MGGGRLALNAEKEIGNALFNLYNLSLGYTEVNEVTVLVYAF